MEYEFPIEIPRFDDEEMIKKKAAYVAKHGYYVHVPGWEDLIKLPIYEEPNEEDFNLWKTRRSLEGKVKWYEEKKLKYVGPLPKDVPITDRVYDDITRIVERKRTQYKKMMASPVPTWRRNITSVVCFLDDVADVTFGVGLAARIVGHFVPRFLAKIFLGPAGWLMILSDIVSILMIMVGAPIPCMAIKRNMHSITNALPITKRARAKHARRMQRIFPKRWEWLRTFQATNTLFGVGTCAGAVFGFAYDALFGTYRAAKGEKVTFSVKPPKLAIHEKYNLKMIREIQALGLCGDELSEEDHLRIIVACNMASQGLKPLIDQWDPLDEVEGIEHVEIQAPRPEHPTTIWMLEDEDVDIDNSVGWPRLDKEWATYDELWGAYQDTTSSQCQKFFERNSRNYDGLLGIQQAYEFGMNMLYILDEKGTPEWDQDPRVAGYLRWAETGCHLDGRWGILRGIVGPQKSHIIPFLNGWLSISGGSEKQPREGWSKARKLHGIYYQCGECLLYFDPSLCPAGYQEVVQSFELICPKGAWLPDYFYPLPEL